MCQNPETQFIVYTVPETLFFRDILPLLKTFVIHSTRKFFDSFFSKPRVYFLFNLVKKTVLCLEKCIYVAHLAQRRLPLHRSSHLLVVITKWRLNVTMFVATFARENIFCTIISPTNTFRISVGGI